MNVELNFLERLLILQLLPKEGNLVTLRVIRDAHQYLGFTPEELEIIKFDTDEKTGRSTWSKEAWTVVGEFEINKTIENMIVKAFKELDKEEKLSLDVLPLYEKFIPTGEE